MQKRTYHTTTFLWINELILGKTVDAITKTVNPTEIRVDEVIQPSRGMRRTIESIAEK